jgi:lipoprotein-anchoring transpeptidase ErfK/SrfK
LDRGFFTIVVATVALAGASAPLGHSSPQPALPLSYPAAGTLVATSAAVRVAPDRHAKVIRVFHQFRHDYRLQIVFAVGETIGADGRTWFHVSVPMRPNGTMGWMPARTVDLHPTKNEIVIDRSARTIQVDDGTKVLLHGRVAVGAPGRETPLGDFYVTARFVPSDPFYGSFALETSAYSRLTDWPGGGIVGIHGTSMPQLLGQAVSHGCVRVANSTARALRRLAPLGTPIHIVG